MAKGRPKGSLNKSTLEIRQAASKLCPEMLRILAKMARSEKTGEAVRKDAALVVLQYGVGKPKEMHEHSGPDGGVIPVSLEGVTEALTNLTKSVISRNS